MQSTYNGKNWCGTVNNFEDSGIEPDGPRAWLERLVRSGICTFAVGQVEEGEECHTQHLQLFLQLKNPARLSWLRRHVHDRAHWEPMRGTAEQAAAYCQKEDTRVAGPWQFGTITVRGKRTGLDDAVAMVRSGAPLRDVIDAFPVIWVHHGRGLLDLRQRLALECDRRQFGPEGPEVWVLYGPSGTGKSRFVASTWPDAFWKIPGEKWWDGYDGHETVVLDDFKDGDLRLTDLQRLLDRYPLWVEVKGGAVPMLAKRYVITSNSHPDTWYSRSDVHKTIMRRVHDYAEQYGRLIYVDEGWVPPADLQRGLGNTSPNPAASQEMEDAFTELIGRLHD
ncbi:replication associated protein [Sigmofec virus UA08Rod_19468]|uniref:Replication-associated protein n=1 Tax=Sigmofec virus UA08Rod_19468 TaxID=2929265 RepID=A0A976N1H6_9VIRU|nr:replication associated protein [Sigmofec virus UA08Rod_19468]